MDSGKNKWIVGFLLLIPLLAGFPVMSLGLENESLLLASRIIDRDVYDGKQKLIGEVDDIIIRRSGKVKKLTVEFGGFLDIGDKLVALPFKNISLKDGKVAVEATEQELEKRAGIDYFRQGLRPDYYYRPRPYTGRYWYPPPGPYYGPHMDGPTFDPAEWAFSPARFLASALLNRRLINEEGKALGRIKDLVIDRKNNKVEKIVLSSIHILGEEIYVALPYEPPGFTAYGLVYEIAPAKLKDFIYPYEE